MINDLKKIGFRINNTTDYWDYIIKKDKYQINISFYEKEKKLYLAFFKNPSNIDSKLLNKQIDNISIETIENILNIFK